MLERRVLIPASSQRLWEALTEPDTVSTWFGARVEWDLRPGGRARFLEDAGSIRDGLVGEVIPGRQLRFRWWPEGEVEATSEVTYQLEAAQGGTRLTVTEAPVSVGEASASASASNVVAFTAWDARLVGVWGRLVVPAALPAF